MEHNSRQVGLGGVILCKLYLSFEPLPFHTGDGSGAPVDYGSCGGDVYALGRAGCGNVWLPLDPVRIPCDHLIRVIILVELIGPPPPLGHE